MSRSLLVCLLLLSLQACSSAPTSVTQTPSVSDDQVVIVTEEGESLMEASPGVAAPGEDLVNRVQVADESVEDKGTPLKAHPEVMLEMNKRVRKWIDYFTTGKRDVFVRFMKRGSSYRSEIERILAESGVPKEFYYLALIESGFLNTAQSHAKAVGMWQFMQGTAERYGLKCINGCDERRDPLRATRAAAGYLRDLYNVFGSWRLALSAYNAGEVRIMRAVMKGKSRDFWTLAEARMLPEETSDYVPKFFAAAIIGRDAKRYGFDLDEPDAQPTLKLVDVPSPMPLRKLADAAGLDEEAFRRFNPHLGQCTPMGLSRYAVWVPEGKADDVESFGKDNGSDDSCRPLRATIARTRSNSSKLLTPKLRAQAQTVSLPRVYRVRRGDTLHRISTRFRVSLASLKRWNRLEKRSIYPGQVLRVSPI